MTNFNDRFAALERLIKDINDGLLRMEEDVSVMMILMKVAEDETRTTSTSSDFDD